MAKQAESKAKPEYRTFEAVTLYRDSEGWRVATLLADESMILRQTEPNVLLVAKDEFKKAAVEVWKKAGAV